MGMDKTNLSNVSSLFDGWTDDQFTAWFAGFFDGEGCIYIPKNAIGMEMSVANTDRPVIDGIHARLGLGIIMQVTFSKKNWKTKFHWRLRNMPEIHSLLQRVRPFLVIKTTKADEALRVAAHYIKLRDDKLARNMRIVEMVKTHKLGEVAKEFGLSRQTVADIRDRGGRTKPMGRRRRGIPDSQIRTSVQTHGKQLVKVTTRSTLIK